MSVSEIEDIKQLLHSHNGDIEKLKKVMSKIMANVYVGKNMSSLFPDIVLQVRVKESSVTRLIGMFTAQYGHLHPETALLCINQLTKDVMHNADYLQRGHALQTLGSLNIPALAEYIAPPIKVALQDSSEYVRRLAIDGCVKIYNMNQDVFEEQLLAQHLVEMTEDFDVSIVVIAIAALVQVKSGYKIKQSLAMSLIKHLSDFTDWQVPIIISAIDAKNLIQCEAELMELLNLVDGFLDDCSPSVVLHIVKLLQYVIGSLEFEQNLNNRFIERIKKPLLFRVKHSNPEVSYMFCLEIPKIISNISDLSGNYRIFIPAYYDPSYLKVEKLRVLSSIITSKNVKKAVSELHECLKSPKHDDILKELVECVALCVLSHGNKMSSLVVQLASLLQSGYGMMISALLPFLENIVLSLDDSAQVILPQLQRCAEFDLTPEASVALLYLLGSYGNILPECVSMFYCYVEEYSNLEPDVKSALLSAIVKQMSLVGMPKICRKLLCLIKDDGDPLIKARASNYCAIIMSNLEKTLKSDQKHHINLCPQDPICFDNYPASSTTKQNVQHIEIPETIKEPCIAEPPKNGANLLDIEESILELTVEDSVIDVSLQLTANSNFSNKQISSNHIRDELSSIFEIPLSATPIQHGNKDQSQTIKNFLLTLSKTTIQPEEYEQNWSKNWKPEKFKVILSKSKISVSSDLQALFSKHSISTMAITPPSVDPQQLFLYSSSAGMLVLMKVLLSFVNNTLEIEVRAANHMMSQMMSKSVQYIVGVL